MSDVVPRINCRDQRVPCKLTSGQEHMVLAQHCSLWAISPLLFNRVIVMSTDAGKDCRMPDRRYQLYSAIPPMRWWRCNKRSILNKRRLTFLPPRSSITDWRRATKCCRSDDIVWWKIKGQTINEEVIAGREFHCQMLPWSCSVCLGHQIIIKGNKVYVLYWGCSHRDRHGILRTKSSRNGGSIRKVCGKSCSGQSHKILTLY